MNNQYNFLLAILTSILCTACGGGGGSTESASPAPITDNQTTITNTVRETENSLADPDAEFSTSKQLKYSAYNTSNYDVTLFVYNRNETLLSRIKVPSNSHKDLSIDIGIADEMVKHSWRYRELSFTQRTSVDALSAITFSHFL